MTWRKYGPRGEQVKAFIDSLRGIPWFENVGEPFDKPGWCEVLDTVESWNAAVCHLDALLYSARDAAFDAAVDAANGTAGTAAVDAAVDAVSDAAGDAAWEVGSRDAVRDSVKYATGAVCEIMCGVEDGYFSHSMEVFQAGHWPVKFDGKKLVVF